MFASTFLSYACYHAVRKAVSAVKPAIVAQEWFGGEGATTRAMAMVDTTFLFTYGVSLFSLTGLLARRFTARSIVLLGLLGSVVAAAAISFLGRLHVHQLWPYLLLTAVSGAMQATGWPASVAIM